MTYAAIRLLTVLGLARGVKLPAIAPGPAPTGAFRLKGVSEPAIARPTVGFPDVPARRRIQHGR